MRRRARDAAPTSSFGVPGLLVLGIAGIGAYALYRLAKAPAGPSAAFDRTAPGAAPFATPADFQPPANSTAALGPMLGMVQARWYGGRIELGAPDASLGLGPDLVAGLQRYGFTGAVGGSPGPSAPVVYASPAEAAGHVPDYALVHPTPGERWFRGRWGLPSQDRPRPQWLPLLWGTLPPRS